MPIKCIKRDAKKLYMKRYYKSTSEAFQMLVWEPEGPGSSLETTDFLTNYGRATKALVSLFTKQSINWYQLASEWAWG